MSGKNAIMALTLLTVTVTPLAFAEQTMLKLVSPTDGATLHSNEENIVSYEYEKRGRVDHMHIWVNGDKGPSIKSKNGKYTLPKLAPGKYAIIAKVVDKGHVPTGPEKSVFVTVK